MQGRRKDGRRSGPRWDDYGLYFSVISFAVILHCTSCALRLFIHHPKSGHLDTIKMVVDPHLPGHCTHLIDLLSVIHQSIHYSFSEFSLLSSVKPKSIKAVLRMQVDRSGMLTCIPCWQSTCSIHAAVRWVFYCWDVWDAWKEKHCSIVSF